eukprot:scaffold28802_cov65-Phaeocystis_antarctica.AAC.4
MQCICSVHAVCMLSVSVQCSPYGPHHLQLRLHGGAAVLVLHPHCHHDHREVEEQQRPAEQRLVELEGGRRKQEAADEGEDDLQLRDDEQRVVVLRDKGHHFANDEEEDERDDERNEAVDSVAVREEDVHAAQHQPACRLDELEHKAARLVVPVDEREVLDLRLRVPVDDRGGHRSSVRADRLPRVPDHAVVLRAPALQQVVGAQHLERAIDAEAGVAFKDAEEVDGICWHNEIAENDERAPMTALDELLALGRVALGVAATHERDARSHGGKDQQRHHDGPERHQQELKVCPRQGSNAQVLLAANLQPPAVQPGQADCSHDQNDHSYEDAPGHARVATRDALLPKAPVVVDLTGRAERACVASAAVAVRVAAGRVAGAAHAARGAHAGADHRGACSVLELAGRADDDHWHRCAHGRSVEREAKREAAETQRAEPHKIGTLARVGDSQIICVPVVVGNQLCSEAAGVVGGRQRVRDRDGVNVARLEGQENFVAEQQLYRRAAQQPVGQHSVDHRLWVRHALGGLNAFAGQLNLTPRAERSDRHGLHICAHRHRDIFVLLRVD